MKMNDINVHTNTAYGRATVNKDTIDTHTNAAYGQIMM